MIEATYIDHMGSDLSVVNAARVSFGKKSEWEHSALLVSPPIQQNILSKRDTKLINYLAKHKHLSPFNHTFITFHVKAPVFVARQLVKHEYMPWNEISRRYVDDEPEFYVPDSWRGRSADKKQGSEGVVYTNAEADFVDYTALRVYKELLEDGVAPEQARMVLPQSTMTEWYWSGTLGAFAKMCNLRCKEDTQYESRLVADQISEKLMELYPVSFKALMGYIDMTQEEWEKMHV